MRFRHIRRGLAAASIAASAFALAGTLPAQAAGHGGARQARPASTAGDRRVIVDCGGHGVVRPRRLIITCADGNEYLAGLRWFTWAATARGRGNDWVNNCVPNCAQGTFHKFPARVLAWRLRPRPHHPRQQYFTRLTLTYTKRVPRGFHRKRVIKLLPTGP